MIWPRIDEITWPDMRRALSAVLGKKVTVTMLTQPLPESPDLEYADREVRSLRKSGAAVIQADDLRGLELVIDKNIMYHGSLPATVSSDGNAVARRLAAPVSAKRYLTLVQADLIRKAAAGPDGLPRNCPRCGWPIKLVNPDILEGPAAGNQPWKIQCMNPQCGRPGKKERDLAPKEAPRCRVDGRTPYIIIQRGEERFWQCPIHPYACPSIRIA